MGVYPASKFAVTALTETLRQELNAKGNKTKITVRAYCSHHGSFINCLLFLQSLSPGYVKTAFAANAGIQIDDQLKEFLSKMKGLKAEDVADAVVYILSTPPHVQVHELIMEAVQA